MALDQVLRTQAQEVNTQAPIYSATVSRVVGSDVYVIAPDYSDFEYGPARGDVPFSPGDSCLLVFDSEANAWAIDAGSIHTGPSAPSNKSRLWIDTDETDDSILDLDARLDILEGRSRVVTASAVSSLSLGAIDGENITGVRITGNLRTASAGGAIFYLKPNNLSTIQAQVQAHRFYWTAGAASADVIFGSNVGASAGLAVAAQDWGSTSNGIWFDGVFYTSRAAGSGYRRYGGTYDNQDFTNNVNNVLRASIYGAWHDNSVAVSLMTLASTVGTFSGRICVEIIP